MRKSLPFSNTECVKDRHGRYVIVKEILLGMVVSILNVYYPSAYPSDFMTTVFTDYLRL